jgi:peptidoglycan hydrolase CwlO-like protein
VGTVIQIVTIVTSVLAGGGLVRLFTVRAERNKILGEGEVAQANAAKTYHQISMEMIQEARQQTNEFRDRLEDISTKFDRANDELDQLRGRIRDLTSELDERNKRIRELERALAGKENA